MATERPAEPVFVTCSLSRRGCHIFRTIGFAAQDVAERDAVEWLNLCAAEDADDPAGWEVVVYGLVRMAVAQREAGGKARIVRMNDARALAAQAAALEEGRIE